MMRRGSTPSERGQRWVLAPMLAIPLATLIAMAVAFAIDRLQAVSTNPLLSLAVSCMLVTVGMLAGGYELAARRIEAQRRQRLQEASGLSSVVRARVNLRTFDASPGP